jgi:butyryl-CoA dehydrogenase
MDFILSNEHKMTQEMYREFARREVKPLAKEIDEEERFPSETVDKMKALGLFGIPFERKYHGQGCDTLSYVLCIEELAKVCAATAVIVSAHTSLCADSVLKFGTEEQKEKYLTALCDGRMLGAFALTEPGAGTDASQIRTTAEKTPDGYVLNGSKVFITNGKEADLYVVMAMTDKSLGQKGISAFLVEKGTPGFSFGSRAKTMGLRASSTYELVFENIQLPPESLLGTGGRGFSQAMAALDGGRIGVAAQALGIAEGAFEAARQYVKERKQFGRPIAAFQNTQFVLAEMYAQIEAARSLVYKAAIAKDTQKKYSVEASTAKLFASQTALMVTEKAVQLHGGYGYEREYEVERMMRDAKVTQIYEGTSEVQKMVISGSLL